MFKELCDDFLIDFIHLFILENCDFITLNSVSGCLGLGVVLPFELPQAIRNILNVLITTILYIILLLQWFNMKKSIFIALTIFISSSALADTIIPRSIEGDRGTYYLIKQSRSGDIVSTLHKRVGVDSTGYTSAKVNCKTKQIKEIGYSEISAKAIKPNPTKWYNLVTGSSKYDLYKFVCTR